MAVVLLVIEAAGIAERVLAVKCAAPEWGLGHFAVEALQGTGRSVALLLGLGCLGDLLKSSSKVPGRGDGGCGSALEWRLGWRGYGRCLVHVVLAERVGVIGGA